MSEMSLKIAGQRFDYFNKFEISLVYNSIASTFSFDGLNISDEQKNLFKPLQYHDVYVYYGNSILITGTGLNTSTTVQNEVSLAGISGYSKPGVLEDCQIPLNLYPLQNENLSIKEITEKIIKPFGLKLIIDNEILSEANKNYESESSEPGKSIKEYITELTRQRNIILTHDYLGNLVFARLKINEKSIATYREGMPSTKITLSVNGQGFHSSISTQKQATIEIDNIGESTITNSLVKDYRPLVKEQTSGDNDDSVLFAKQIRGAELRNIALIIETDRFTWYDGKKVRIIRPNNIVDVISPSNFINRRTRFFVEKVELRGDMEGTAATITCVVPEVYNSDNPKNYFT